MLAPAWRAGWPARRDRAGAESRRHPRRRAALLRRAAGGPPVRARPASTCAWCGCRTGSTTSSPTSRNCTRRRCRARQHRRARASEPRDLYASSTPVFASTGEGVALIEARLPASGSRRRGGPASCARLGVDRVRCWPCWRVLAALLLARRIVRSAAGAGRVGDAARPRRFLHVDPGVGRRPETAALARTHGGHAAQPRRPHGDAAPARSRGAGDAARRRRGRVRRRCGSQRALPESAGRAHARASMPARPRPLLRRRAASPARQGRPASVRDRCPIVAARERGQAQATEFLQRAGRRAAHRDHHQRRAWSTACRCR